MLVHPPLRFWLADTPHSQATSMAPPLKRKHSAVAPRSTPTSPSDPSTLTTRRAGSGARVSASSAKATTTSARSCRPRNTTR